MYGTIVPRGWARSCSPVLAILCLEQRKQGKGTFLTSGISVYSTTGKSTAPIEKVLHCTHHVETHHSRRGSMVFVRCSIRSSSEAILLVMESLAVRATLERTSVHTQPRIGLFKVSGVHNSLVLSRMRERVAFGSSSMTRSSIQMIHTATGWADALGPFTCQGKWRKGDEEALQ